MAGMIWARFGSAPEWLLASKTSLYALYIFMFLTGLGIGADRRIGEMFRSLSLPMLFLPLITTIGSLAGVSCIAFICGYKIWDSLAVAAGFGYYSLSSIFIAQYRGPELGAVALLANIMRELLVLALAPFLYKYFGAAPLVCAGGCTTSDTTLPVIARYAGSAWIFPAIFHAMILDFSVPFWVTLFCSL